MTDAPARHATVPVPVVLGLADGARVEGTLHLVAEGEPPAAQPVASLLDGPRAFFAISLPEGRTELVGRAAVATVEMPADAPGAPATGDGGGGIDIVTFHLETGGTVTGVLHVRPEQSGMRMSDIFNGPEGWAAADLGDRVVLVNKARVARVSF